MTEPFGKRPKLVKAFNCPSCGGTVRLRARGISVTAVCEHCNAVIDAADPNLRILQKVDAAVFTTDLEIGVRGELHGVLWEVIGYVRKAVAGTVYRWDEYLLFNPWHGFRFLSKSNGHWTFFKRLNERINGLDFRKQIKTQGAVFNLFNKDTARVEAVKGEFYWRVKVGDETEACDYICPPYMLSSESTRSELNVSLGIYVPHTEIAAAFGVKRLQPTGIGACQPPPFRHTAGKIFGVTAFAITAAILIQIGSLIGLPHQKVLEISDHPAMPALQAADTATGTWSFDPLTGGSAQNTGTEGTTLTTEPFRLDGNHGVRLRTDTNLDNAWAEFNLSLVNEKTGQTYAVRQGVEHYRGYDGGESWQEGSNHAETLLSRVPAGEYRLLVDTDSDVFSKREALPFRLTLERGITDWTNLLLTVILIGAFPLYVLGRRYSFESARWSESAYSPYGSSES